MRAAYKVAALALPLVLGACSKHEEPTAGLADDLKRDLAAASAPGLATAPQSFQRMRFVSAIEQSRATERARKPKVAHQHHMAAAESPSSEVASTSATDAVESMVAAPAAVLTAEASVPEPSVVVAARPVPEPSHGGPSAEGDVLDHAGSGIGGMLGGIGGILGGIAGTAVIRGGRAGVDKCDPRTDGRMRPQGRPDFSMPSPIGRPIFGGAGRR